MHKSVWNDTCEIPEFPAQESDLKTQVLIIGGGLAGLISAYMLTKEGIDCLLIEAEELMSGVSGNTTAKITSQHGLIYHKLLKRYGAETARLYWEANEAALGRYRQLCQDIQCGFETKDSFIYTLDNPELLDRELDALTRLNIPVEYSSELPLPFAVAGAVKFRDQAQFHPLKFAAAITSGLRILEHTRALAVEGNTVLTDRGRIKAEKIIVCTHYPIFNKYGLYFVKLYQERSCVLALEGAAEVKGMYRDEAQDGLSFRNQGDLLLLGGSAHRTGKQGAGWEELRKAAKEYYPSSVERYNWAAQDCMSLDGMPYIGQYGRNTPGLYVATGFNKWGMSSSMLAASILCCMLRGGYDPHAGIFSPRRSMMHTQLISNLLETTVNLLTPTTPRCPHMGCALKWNAQEQSWDCPCHGSRFTKDGELLDNPSTGDLKK